MTRESFAKSLIRAANTQMIAPSACGIAPNNQGIVPNTKGLVPGNSSYYSIFSAFKFKMKVLVTLHHFCTLSLNLKRASFATHCARTVVMHDDAACQNTET